MDIAGTVGSLRDRTRNMTRPGVVNYAISALDIALWDLKARLLDLPLHRLLGAVRDSVPVYGSGGFVTYDDDQLRDQLTGWVATQGIPRVKIKIGQDWGADERRDVARIGQAREIIGPDCALYVDANGAYTAKQAIRVMAAVADEDVTWLEEPVSSQDLAGLRQVRDAVSADVAAGEYTPDMLRGPAPVRGRCRRLPAGRRLALRRHQRVPPDRRRRCVVRPGRLRPLRPPPARSRLRQRPQRPAHRVVPRPHPDRVDAVRRHPRPHRRNHHPSPRPARTRPDTARRPSPAMARSKLRSPSQTMSLR